MPRKQKVFIGTRIEVFHSIEAAQREFDASVEHICNEDGNPYSAMVEWRESPDHIICPDCNRPHHIVNGHACRTNGGDLVVSPQKVVVVVSGGVVTGVYVPPGFKPQVVVADFDDRAAELEAERPGSTARNRDATVEKEFEALTVGLVDATSGGEAEERTGS